jgi:hypothetical protein
VSVSVSLICAIADPPTVRARIRASVSAIRDVFMTSSI